MLRYAPTSAAALKLIFAALQECWRALRIFMARFLSGCVAVPICDSRPPLLWGELIIILRSLQETRIFTMLTTSAFAQTSGAAASGGASFIVQLLPLLLIFVVFYFLLIRPQQKKDRKSTRLTSSH